jgi:hypothetical protein
MASPSDPNHSSRRTRNQIDAAPPVGAQALTNDAAPSTPPNEAGLEVGRNPRERAARQTHNSIQLAATESASNSGNANSRGSESAASPRPDQRAVPDRVAQRYSKVGDNFHFPDGNVAFRDEGTRLSTQLENREVVRDLIAIAQTRGWAIEISGTKAFKQRAWQEAQVAGLTVRNYEATELEQQQLARRLSRDRSTAPEAAASGGASDPPPNSSGTPAESAPVRDPAPPPASTDRVYRGRLVDHGIERYQFDPRQDESYFVILDTPDKGEQVIWGKDLQRALEQSLSKPRDGQEVVVRQLGAKPVTVTRPVRDEEGQVVSRTEVKTHLNRWLVETEEFLRDREKLAEVVRDVGIDPKRAVSQHPELAGTYGELHAAKLVALQQHYRHPADLERFVARTREAIAQEIERGEPLSPPLVKARYQGEGSQRMREQVQQRTL